MIETGNNIEESNIFNFECATVHYNLLVVEDSQFFSRVLSKSLRDDGHRVSQAFSLKEAYQFLDTAEFDYILLDLVLPDGEGDELIDTLPKEMRAKVIVLSGDEDTQRREYIFKSGVLDYFSKLNSFYIIVHDIKNLLCTVEQNKYMNILLVDDSIFTRKTLRNILEPKGYNIFDAKDAIEGLKILDNQDIHLVLLDYEMPIMDGAKMLEKIKGNMHFLELPVIMLSGHDNQDIVSRVLKHGASDFIRKPFANEELLLKCDLQIKNYINLKRMKSKELELEHSLKKVREIEAHKSMFLANMSHEIRTPLNSILGFVDLLAEDEKDEKKIDYLKTIQKSGSLLLNIINDVLDFSKIENNKLDINKEVFVLEELFRLMVSLYTPLMASAGLEFTAQIDPNLPKYFKSDFLRIKQILTNLLGNAMKFTPKDGTVTFEIKFSNEPNFIEFSVTDSGIGIATANHKKVFELFEQAESDTTKKFGGTGLGLSISAKLAALLDGRIELESELGEGSRFNLIVPIAELNHEETHELEAAKSKSAQKSEVNFKKHILLVEDILPNQKYMAIVLKKLGVTFDIANDGVEAVEMFKKNPYDLILMDENMPNMNGIEATKEILEYEIKNKLPFTPIIALTANALKGDREKFLAAGMDEYLTKPVNKKVLSDMLEKFFN